MSLPRPRGDPPDIYGTVEATPESPPPPRGSTPCWPAPASSWGVSPAPAGIHPLSGRRGCGVRRLPRPRGDPPFAPRSGSDARRSPPPPRGSTHSRSSQPRFQSVSPAPAGSPPSRRRADRASRGLPRPRGDPPAPGWTASPPWSSPPPPRGSTRNGRVDLINRAVSPAPAGIHPPVTWSGRASRCLPRPRGDPPLVKFVRPGVLASPPPPRGSTHALGPVPMLLVVSPAPAGIHPLGRDDPRRWRRLPRPRGDPPRPRARGWRGAPSPPPPRGSTRGSRVGPCRRDVSPAPAGIHRGRAARPGGNGGLPRPRGDPPDRGRGAAHPI